jgi:peptidoglycan/xylan/chitin deacetylase (PgdA/CDA1 family)
MVYSNALYRPTLLELAQTGNCRALTYWMNSFLGPQGVQVQVQPAPEQYLKILVEFRRPQSQESCLKAEDRLVRFICYRLWTLNSQAIRGIRVVARMAGDPKVLWHTSVRINSPAVMKLRQVEAAQLRQVHLAGQVKFRILRSLFMSSVTLAGFFAGYWLFYLQMGRMLSKGKPSEAPTLENPTDATPSQTNRAAGQSSSAIGDVNQPIPAAFYGQVVSQVDGVSDKVIALTFDDGPHSEVTAQILDILQQYNIRATFFMSGSNVEQLPDLARRVVTEGHAVGNRGWSRSLGSGQDIKPKREIDETSNLIQATTGVKPEIFRPVKGNLDPELLDYAKQEQYAITLWSVDSQDTMMAAPLVLDNVLRNAQPGRIVLLHDRPGATQYSATVQALPQLITTLRQQGYRFVTVPQLLNLKKAQGQNRETQLPLKQPEVARAASGRTATQEE